MWGGDARGGGSLGLRSQGALAQGALGVLVVVRKKRERGCISGGTFSAQYM